MNDELSGNDWSAEPLTLDLDAVTSRASQSDEEETDEPTPLPLPGSTQDSAELEDSRASDLGPLTLYLREIRQIPLLQPAEEIALARAIQQGSQARTELTRTDVSPAHTQELRERIRRGETARRQMTEANLRLVVSVAKKYRGRGLPLLDLIQEGNLGLARAVAKYDYRLGNRFSTYATWWIRQAVSRALADQGRTIRLPAHIGDQLTALNQTRRHLEQELGREATVDELARAMGITSEKVRALTSAAEHPLSLETPVGETGEGRLGELIEDTTTPSLVELATQVLLRDDVAAVLGRLPERQRRVLELRFGLTDGRDRTLAEVGRELGLTRERARQLEGKALAQLRSAQLRAALRDHH